MTRETVVAECLDWSLGVPCWGYYPASVDNDSLVKHMRREQPSTLELAFEYELAPWASMVTFLVLPACMFWNLLTMIDFGDLINTCSAMHYQCGSKFSIKVVVVFLTFSLSISILFIYLFVFCLSIFLYNFCLFSKCFNVLLEMLVWGYHWLWFLKPLDLCPFRTF